MPSSRNQRKRGLTQRYNHKIVIVLLSLTNIGNSLIFFVGSLSCDVLLGSVDFGSGLEGFCGVPLYCYLLSTLLSFFYLLTFLMYDNKIIDKRVLKGLIPTVLFVYLRVFSDLFICIMPTEQSTVTTKLH